MKIQNKLKSVALAALLLLLPALSFSQSEAGGQLQGWVTFQEDISAGSYTYCALYGANGNPFGNPLVGTARIKTTGSSTSVTEVTAGTNPFTDLAVGDILLVRRNPNYVDRVVIVTKTDAANVVVNSAVDWSAGFSFSWLDKACGTSNMYGWFPVGVFSVVQVSLEWITDNAASIDYSFECSLGNGLPITIDTETATAVGQWSTVLSSGIYDRCRLGLKVSGDVGTNTSNAYLAVKW